MHFNDAIRWFLYIFIWISDLRVFFKKLGNMTEEIDIQDEFLEFRI